jgi:hypothetical protein
VFNVPWFFSSELLLFLVVQYANISVLRNNLHFVSVGLDQLEIIKAGVTFIMC